MSEENSIKLDKIKKSPINTSIRKENQEELLIIIAEELVQLNHYFSNDRLRKLLEAERKK